MQEPSDKGQVTRPMREGRAKSQDPRDESQEARPSKRQEARCKRQDARARTNKRPSAKS